MTQQIGENKSSLRQTIVGGMFGGLIGVLLFAILFTCAVLNDSGLWKGILGLGAILLPIVSVFICVLLARKQMIGRRPESN